MSRWTAPLSALASRVALSPGARRDVARMPQQRTMIDMRTPVPLSRSIGVSSRFFGDREPSAGFLAELSIYGQDGVIYPIVARLSEGTAAQTWRLWTKSASGLDEDRRAVKSHGVLDFLAHPNDFQTWAEVVESAQQHFELVGELDIILGFAGGVRQPIDCWVLRPDRIAPVPDPDEFLAGWVYTSPDGGQKIPLEVRELMRTRRPNPLDPYRGKSAIASLLRDLDAQFATRDWQAAFFQNSARPGGIIEVDRHLDDAEWDEMNARWSDGHKGVSKAHRVAILEHGAKWTETAFSLRDMQIAELETVSRDKALVAFGMPKSMLGIVEDVNRANAEAGQYLYAQEMIRPRLMRWKAMLNKQLLPLFGARGAAGMELDFDDPVPENSEANIAELKAKAEVVVSLIAGHMDAAKVLEMVDWPDLGYTKPEPAMLPMSRPGQGPTAPEEDSPAQDDDVSRETKAHFATDIGQREWVSNDIDNAMRWKAVGHPDASCCEFCLKNLGKLYRNRSDAYSDYPNGRSYIKCVGEKYGNHCRCRVIKRRDS